MQETNKFQNVKNKLDQVGKGFCLAKWTQVTMHLHNGMTLSCHHPGPHKIPLEEIRLNPTALHNTNFKKLKRKDIFIILIMLNILILYYLDLKEDDECEHDYDELDK